MRISGRQAVLDTLNFNNPGRVATQIWDVPWTYMNYPEEMKRMREQYPDDVVWCPRFLKCESPTVGDQYEIGQYIDEWGCIFENKQRGIIGEVKKGIKSSCVENGAMTATLLVSRLLFLPSVFFPIGAAAISAPSC